jgi:2',3'-cyclic-nucleotide 2'-phosphodiesterase (5'-nucleotidase family)
VAILLVTSGTTLAIGSGVAASERPTSATIEEIQRPAGNTTDSPLAGSDVTTSGIVTATNADGFFLQNGTGAFSGVYVAGSADVSEGDRVDVTGLVEESYGLTRINTTASGGEVTVTGTAQVPAPTPLTTANVSREAYEGVLVTVSSVTVTRAPSASTYGEWSVSDGSGDAVVDDVTTGSVTVPDETGGTVETLTGPVYFSYSEFKIQPKTLENYTAPTPTDGGPEIDGTTLTVLSYNDIQTAASNPTKMGRLVGAVQQRRGAVGNPTVVVGGGDQVSPSSLSPVSNWTVPVETLNVLDPAAEVVGNHDLDYGFEPVRNFSAASEFPWLVANVRQTDGGSVPGTKNYTVVERGGVRIGVVGLVDEAIKPKTAVKFGKEGYEVTDFVTTGDRIATKLKEEENVDVVIAAAHIGVPESKELARGTDDIDLIVTGDDEVAFGPKTVDGTTIMEAEARAEYLAEANLTVGNDTVAFENGTLRTVAENDAFPVNETAERIVDESRGKYLSKVAGRTTAPLDSTFSSNYAEDTGWGSIVTDSFRAQTGAEVAITNAGGIRGNFVIDEGSVTYDDVYTSLPFGNYLVTKEMTGEQLREFLASQVTQLDASYGGQAQLQVSGITYEFVDRPGAEAEVTDVYVGGEPLDPDATYDVTVNSYMAGWTFGDRYGWNMSDLPTVENDYTLYGTATVEYIEANSPVSPPETDRIRRVTTDVGVASVTTEDQTTVLTFEKPANATAINATSFGVENETSGAVDATDARLDGDALVVSVATSELRALDNESESLQVYGRYNDSHWNGQRSGFENSVVNGDVRLAGGADSLAVLAGGDRVPQTAEVQTAIRYWARNEPVPQTGETLSSTEIQQFIRAWANQRSVAS